MKQEAMNESVKNFVGLLHEAPTLAHAEDLVTLVMNMTSNTIGAFTVMDLSECNCSKCRKKMKLFVEENMELLLQKTRQSVDINLEANGIESLFTENDPNADLREELIKESSGSPTLNTEHSNG